MREKSVFSSGPMTVLKLEKLFRITEKRLPPERFSSRLVKSASYLDAGELIGWQMTVPVRGRADIFLFGTASLCRSDLEWITEKTGKSKKAGLPKGTGGGYGELYEVSLPVCQHAGAPASIGFESRTADPGDPAFDKWPGGCMPAFEELVSVLRLSGGILRVTAGPASGAEQAVCRKNTIRTFDVRGADPGEYVGRPVRIRTLLRLPAAPSVRLKTVVEEACPGAVLRRAGSMTDPEVMNLWDAPLESAPVLPEYAARVMTLEPELFHPIVGVETCEEEIRKIPASHRNTKKKGAVVIGRALDTAGIKRAVTIGEMDLKRHYQIVGQTGTGKSTLLANLILSAAEQGHGVTFFDPHGSTIDVILRSLPKKSADKVRVVRIGDAANPVPLNIWDSDDPEKEERNISDLCELFADIFDPRREGIVGPRYERWLSTFAKASIALLGKRASLESIAEIAKSRGAMQQLYMAIDQRYPELANVIQEEYIKDRSSEFAQFLGWYLSKFTRLTSVEQLRKTLGAGANALDFARCMETDTITLIDLAVPAIGTHAARIIGTLILMKLWKAAMERRERERTHLVVVDEAALFQTNPMPRMLAEARKFGISMVLCHQHTGQLTQEIRDALEANSANFSAFRLSPRDAATAAIRFDDPAMHAYLTRLNAFNAITTLSVDGSQTAPFTLEISRPRAQSNGAETAAGIEKQSIRTLVEPYRELRALTPSEIREIMERSAQDPDPSPAWLDEWIRRRDDLKQAV